MSTIKVTPNPGASGEAPSRRDTALHDAIARVRDRCGGSSVEEVYAELLREVKDAMPAGFFPNGTRLRDVALDIAEAS